MEPWVLGALAVVAAAAGWVDAIAGGGGILQLPSIRAAGIPLEPVPRALGVNKVSSICGTTAAVLRYASHGHVRWRVLAVPGALALAGSVVGARVVVGVARRAGDVVDAAFAGCFLALAVWQGAKALRGERPAAAPARPRPVAAAALAFAIGVYDGAVGPGTGMFLFWMFTTCLALPPLDATGSTKAVNWLTNAGALAGLLASGAVAWTPALVMAGANVLGGALGARTAVRRGVVFVRVVTALVSAAVSVYLVVRALAD
jgi:uncharacterized membrane protein YfcA